MKRYLPFIIIAAVAITAVGAGAALYRIKHERIAAANVNVGDPAGAKPGAQPARVRGSAKATVTVEEYADFQCPPCGGLSGVVKELEKKYGEQLRIVFRHYPLKMHANAVPAALAAEAAGLQGKFWEMHDQLFQNQAGWSKAPNPRALFAGYATTIGIDPERFAKDMDNEKLKARVAADQERANSLGVSQTPTVFINGEKLPSQSLSTPGLQAAIEAAAQGKKQANVK